MNLQRSKLVNVLWILCIALIGCEDNKSSQISTDEFVITATATADFDSSDRLKGLDINFNLQDTQGFRLSISGNDQAEIAYSNADRSHYCIISLENKDGFIISSLGSTGGWFGYSRNNLHIDENGLITNVSNCTCESMDDICEPIVFDETIKIWFTLIRGKNETRYESWVSPLPAQELNLATSLAGDVSYLLSDTVTLTWDALPENGEIEFEVDNNCDESRFDGEKYFYATAPATSIDINLSSVPSSNIINIPCEVYVRATQFRSGVVSEKFARGAVSYVAKKETLTLEIEGE